MSTTGTPPPDHEIDDELVQRLVATQFPEYGDEPLARAANGWDYVIYRLGKKLAVRLPRRHSAAALVVNEQRWLPQIAPTLPIPVPAPIAVGGPAYGYPWTWSITPWFVGELAADLDETLPASEAERLGAFLSALHRPAPPDAPHNPYRARSLETLTEPVETRLEWVEDRIDAPAVHALWKALVDTPSWGHDPVWIHGDLHTANMLVANSAISAVIDFVDITAGDPAVDVAVAWMVFGADCHAVFRAAAPHIDDETWTRGKAWALYFALLYLGHSADNERFGRMGQHLLASLTDGG